MENNLVEELSEQMAEQVAKATDDGFVKGVKWISEFMVLELEYQNLSGIAQKLRRFITMKEEEWKQLKT